MVWGAENFVSWIIFPLWPYRIYCRRLWSGECSKCATKSYSSYSSILDWIGLNCVRFSGMSFIHSRNQAVATSVHELITRWEQVGEEFRRLSFRQIYFFFQLSFMSASSVWTEWRCASKVREQLVFAGPVEREVNRCVIDEVMSLTIHGF